MSYSITDLLGLGNVLNKFVEENSFRIIFQIKTQPHEVECPDCHRKTKSVHDYRWQLIKCCLTAKQRLSMLTQAQICLRMPQTLL